jgi:hypothetical protein
MACVSGGDGARLEDINASHGSASSLSRGIMQNACQLHYSHVTMHSLRYGTCSAELERRENEHHETSPITERVIDGGCVHNPFFRGPKWA